MKQRFNPFMALMALLVILAFIALPQTQAELGNPQSLVLNSNITSGASLTFNSIVSAVGSPNLNVSIVSSGATAGVTNPGTLTFQKSVDGSDWTTGTTAAFTPTGTTTATTIANIATGGVPYWRLTTVDNTANGAICTVTVTASKDSSSVSSIGTTLKVGGTAYTPSAASIIPALNATKAATTQAALTLSGATITYVGVDGSTNSVYAITNATINAVFGFASSTAVVVTNAQGTAVYQLKLTP